MELASNGKKTNKMALLGKEILYLKKNKKTIGIVYSVWIVVVSQLRSYNGAER